MERVVIKDVRVPWYLSRNGIRGTAKGFPNQEIVVLGADSETVRGHLYTIQLSGSKGRDAEIFYCDHKDGFLKLASRLALRVKEGALNYVFFHNLRFDLTMMLEGNWEEIYDQYNEINLERDGHVLKLLYGRVNFARVRKDLGGYLCKRCGNMEGARKEETERGEKFVCRECGGGARRNLGPEICFVDSMAFCPPGSRSLSAALKIYGVEEKKLPAPEGLGRARLKGPEFERYALNDAVAVEALGNKIIDLHREYDVGPCVSLPHLSSKILKKHFMRPNESFQLPRKKALYASELSYHAGKNGFYVKRGRYEDVYEYDINSAFPKAMRELPQMVEGSYVKTRKFLPNRAGIYCVSGRFDTARPVYPLVYDSSFCVAWPDFYKEWITGYEYARLLKDKRYFFELHHGYVWKEKKAYKHSPLAEFVDVFYRKKQEAPKGPKRDTYKNILNSLYGKFAACVEKRQKVETFVGEVTLEKTGSGTHFEAGSLYQPFIATQITGYVRALLYDYEIASESLHSATDSVKTLTPLPTSGELGGLKLEVWGRCFLFRNKLYLHFGKDNKSCGHDFKKGWIYLRNEEVKDLRLREVGDDPKTGARFDPVEGAWRGKLFTEDGQHLCKWGLHGFKGSPFLLYREQKEIMESGFLGYEYGHLVSLREGINRGERVGDMIRRFERLSLDKSEN